MYCDGNKVADVVPADMVVNASIVCAWKTSIEGMTTGEPRIYNYVSSCENPTTWNDLMKRNAEYGIHFPTVHAIWYYSFSITNNWYLYLLQTLFLHFIPGFLADTACTILGKEARYNNFIYRRYRYRFYHYYCSRLIKAYKKFYNLNKKITYFTTNQWKFTNYNTQRLCKELNLADYQIFNLDMSKFEWERHAETFIAGLRVYVVKDPITTIPEGKIRWKR